MAAVSANTLFHFTNKEALEGILNTFCFWPKYSLEHFDGILPSKSIFRKAYVPHVCFCDLTITQLANNSIHTAHFGKYGIGLKKDWGIENSVSPVVYVHKNSLPSNNINELIFALLKIRDDFPEEEFPQHLRTKMLELVKYMKPYSGVWQKNKNLKKEIVYYNEREWRYCPKGEKKIFNVLSGIKRGNSQVAERINDAFKKNNVLKFQPDDIKYIIIDTNKEIDNFSTLIDNLNVSDSIKNELKTKIITFDEIDSDF